MIHDTNTHYDIIDLARGTLSLRFGARDEHVMEAKIPETWPERQESLQNTVDLYFNVEINNQRETRELAKHCGSLFQR